MKEFKIEKKKMMQKTSICKPLSKILLFILSIILWFLSTVLSYIALTVLFTYKAYHNVIIINYTTVPLILLITVAIFMFIVGLLGIFALFTNNRYLLITYFILLFTLFATEIVAFSIGFAYRLKIDEYIENGLDKTIKEMYGHTNTTKFTHPLDYIQSKFQCCGEKNYTDWKDTYWYAHRSTNEINNDTQVPQSCCVSYKYQYKFDEILNATVSVSSHVQKIYCTARSPKPTGDDNYFVDGCYLKLKLFIYENYKYFLATLIAYLFIHLISLISVLALINYKLKLLKRSSHPPYVNIEAEYEDEYTNQVTQS